MSKKTHLKTQTSPEDSVGEERHQTSGARTTHPTSRTPDGGTSTLRKLRWKSSASRASRRSWRTVGGTVGGTVVSPGEKCGVAGCLGCLERCLVMKIKNIVRMVKKRLKNSLLLVSNSLVLKNPLPFFPLSSPSIWAWSPIFSSTPQPNPGLGGRFSTPRALADSAAPTRKRFQASISDALTKERNLAVVLAQARGCHMEQRRVGRRSVRTGRARKVRCVFIRPHVSVEEVESGEWWGVGGVISEGVQR